MAIDSHYLRRKIKYHITQLKKYVTLHDKDITSDKVDRYYSAVEIQVIEIAVLTRKLRDLGKLPDNTLENEIIDLIKYESNGPESQRPFVSMEDEYNLDSPMRAQLPLARVVDLVVHSYILQAWGNNGNEYYFTSVLVTSDKTRFDGLYEINLSNLINACLKVCDTHPYRIEASYDVKKRHWVKKRS